MNNKEKYSIVTNAVRKIVGNKDIDEEKNLLEFMGPLDAVYVLTFIEREANVDFTNKFTNNPDVLSVNGLMRLL